MQQKSDFWSFVLTQISAGFPCHFVDKFGNVYNHTRREQTAVEQFFRERIKIKAAATND